MEPLEPLVKPSSLAAFSEALNGKCGDLDAWLECNDDAGERWMQVRISRVLLDLHKITAS